MSEVKRYGVISRGFIGEDTKGKYVTYEDYADLQQKLNAALAENVALKEGNQLALDIICDDNTYVALPWQSSINKVGVETPATDAILNAVRAEGAQYCIDAIVTSDSDDFIDAPNICAEVIRKLRAGSTEGGV